MQSDLVPNKHYTENYNIISIIHKTTLSTSIRSNSEHPQLQTNWDLLYSTRCICWGVDHLQFMSWDINKHQHLSKLDLHIQVSREVVCRALLTLMCTCFLEDPHSSRLIWGMCAAKRTLLQPYNRQQVQWLLFVMTAVNSKKAVLTSNCRNSEVALQSECNDWSPLALLWGCLYIKCPYKENCCRSVHAHVQLCVPVHVSSCL